MPSSSCSRNFCPSPISFWYAYTATIIVVINANSVSSKYMMVIIRDAMVISASFINNDVALTFASSVSSMNICLSEAERFSTNICVNGNDESALNNPIANVLYATRILCLFF